MDLAALIEDRRAHGGGSLRKMAQRSRDADPKNAISHVSLGAYARGEVTSMPSEKTRRALAAALDVTEEEVFAAAIESTAPERAQDGDPERSQPAQAFLRLTSGRSDAEIEQLLGVVAAALAAMDASRETERPHSPSG